MIKIFKKIKKWVYAQLAKLTPESTAVKGASLALLGISGLLFLAYAIWMAKQARDPWLLFFCIGLAIVCILTVYLTLWVFKKLSKIPKKYQRAFLIALPLLFISLAFEGYYVMAGIIITSELFTDIGGRSFI